MPMYYSNEQRKNNNDDYYKDYVIDCGKDYGDECSKDYDDDWRKDHHEDHKKDYHCDCKKEQCDSVKGNSFDVEIKKRDCEIRADIVVGRKRRCIRLWGQVKDCDGIPVEDALVKLLKVCHRNGKIEFEGVAHTQTDCLGFYQFEVCPNEENVKFRVIVSKASRGHERKIDDEHGFCDPCKD